LFGDSQYGNDEAAKQLLIYASHLNDPKTGLMFHAYDESGASTWADPVTHHSAEFWCRAMGWFGMTLVEVLETLPKNHPKRAQLISQVKQLVKAWANYQDKKTGLWYQVVDKGQMPDNWLETSSSSMYSYVTAMAVERGYVARSYMNVAKKGYNGVLTKISKGPDGLTNITDICEGTNVSDLAYYFARKRNTNDFHGLGAFLIMNEKFMTMAGPAKTKTSQKSTNKN
jgi:unsaturated rhamnogalacturonyl hydrolase